MALFINEATSSLSDLLTKLNTFLTNPAGGFPNWSADEFDTGAGIWAISKGDVEVAFAWDTSAPSNLAIYQYHTGLGAGNYSLIDDPWDQVGDSGSGAASFTNATIFDHRNCSIGNAPIQYWAYTEDDTVNIMIETTSGEYVQLGFGMLDKSNDWTGGSYAYGTRFRIVTSNFAVQPRSCHLLDGHASGTGADDMQDFSATIHMEGFPGQAGSSIWGVCMAYQPGGTSGNGYHLGTDRASNARVQVTGGYRASLPGSAFGLHRGTVTAGSVSSYPIQIVHSDRDDSNLLTEMGVMAGIRGISLSQIPILNRQAFGGSFWRAFPSKRRQSTGTLTGSSGHQGMICREAT